VVLLSALKRLLALESGGSDILVATNLALRHRREVQDIVGPLTDTLIVRTHLPHGHGSLTALRRVRDAFASACGHRDIPFEEMARRLEAETGVERRQFAQTFFLLDEGGPAASATASQADEQGDFFKAALHDYDLMLYLERGGDRIEGQLTLKGRLGDGSVARELLCGHRALLHDLVGSLAQEP
jgi:non-ribosomal peptide synthetase component F